MRLQYIATKFCSVETNVAPAKPLAATSGQRFGQIPLVKIPYYLALTKGLVFGQIFGIWLKIRPIIK